MISAMTNRVIAFLSALLVAGAGVTSVSAQTKGYTPPRTPWGDPDLQGVWPGTEMVGVPLQRPKEFGTRNVLSDAEFAKRVEQAKHQLEIDTMDFDIDSADTSNAGEVGSATSPPPHWLERGKPSHQASLIVDPPDGRTPPLTPAAQTRNAAAQEARRDHGPADSWLDRSLYDRCITRGVIGSILPVIYNNGNEIVQAPGYVVLRNEMIHEARVIPLDGREHVSSGLRTYMGDSRGHWEGNTLVVETTNLTDKTGIGPNGGGTRNSEALEIVERFTMTDPNTLEYEATISDPDTWMRPWTIAFPWKRDAGPSYSMFEYACHEGNYALRNILSGARAEEKKNAKSR
jgi:hypothetical protein